MIICNNTTADFVLISADVLLEMTTILKELRISLDYKLRILGQKIEEFLFLVHKLSVIPTALQYNGAQCYRQ